jgi:hypothetical protein
MGVLKLGTVGLDGTKIHANASRHSALSWDHAGKLEAQLKAEVADLLARAEAADEADVPDGMSIPEELALREKRLAKLAEARARIEAQARERYARERAEHEAKLAARGQDRRDRQEARRQAARAAGRRAAAEGPDQSHRRRLADHAGFGRRLRAELQRASCVAAGSLLVVAADVVQAPNDKQQLEPMLDKIEALPERLARSKRCWRRRLFQRGECRGLPGGQPRTADRYGPSAASSPAWRALREGGARTGKSDARRGHGPSVEDARRPQALCFAQADASAGVRHHQVGARIPPVFVARSRQSEWSLVTMAWNLKRMFVLAPA